MKKYNEDIDHILTIKIGKVDGSYISIMEDHKNKKWRGHGSAQKEFDPSMNLVKHVKDVADVFSGLDNSGYWRDELI